jgi:hypothetical protein
VSREQREAMEMAVSEEEVSEREAFEKEVSE